MSNSAVSVSPSGNGVIQVVNSIITASSSFSISSTSTWLDITGVSIAITPLLKNSKVVLFATLNAVPSSNVAVGLAFANGGSLLSVGSGGSTLNMNTQNPGTAGTTPGTMYSTYVMDVHSPNSIATQTYTIQCWCSTAAQTLFLNRTDTDTNSNLFGRFITEIIAMEVV